MVINFKFNLLCYGHTREKEKYYTLFSIRDSRIRIVVGVSSIDWVKECWRAIVVLQSSRGKVITDIIRKHVYNQLEVYRTRYTDLKLRSLYYKLQALIIVSSIFSSIFSLRTPFCFCCCTILRPHQSRLQNTKNNRYL